MTPTLEEYERITTIILRNTDGIFHQYLFSHSIGNKFSNRLTNENVLLVKLLSVIFGLSVIKLPMNLLTGKARQKKFVRFIPSVFPNDKIPYTIFPYNRHNTVYNDFCSNSFPYLQDIHWLQDNDSYQLSNSILNQIQNFKKENEFD
jgi:hypothetical protein